MLLALGFKMKKQDLEHEGKELLKRTMRTWLAFSEHRCLSVRIFATIMGIWPALAPLQRSQTHTRTDARPCTRFAKTVIARLLTCETF